MNRSLKLSVLLALALGSTQAAAVQLGQVQVKSALGQPLLAEIPVTPSSPGELSSLSAQLAPLADYDRAGISDGRPTVDLHFGLANEGGHEVIRITSAQPVNDPYLDLLVEVSTRAGKSVREVTILLDPPGSYAAAAPAAPAPAPARKQPRPAAASAPAPARPAAAARPVASEGTYGPVQRGDTLSAIAIKEAADGVDTNQMLLALKQANPDAFYKDNINALKSGAVLRVPTATEARAMSVANAMAEVRRQNGEWTGNRPTTATAVADAATLPGTASSPSGGGKARDHLALVPPKSGASGAGGGDKASGKLREDLLRSQESLTSLQQQSGELKSRLKDLEDINNKNQRLLSLKDNEIAELQHKLAEARKAANLPPAAAQAPAKPVASAMASKQATPAGNASVGKTMAVAGSTALAAPVGAMSTRPAAVAPKVPTKIAKTAPAKPANRPVVNEAPWYMQPWVWEAAGGAFVVLLLIALLARRRKTIEPKPASSSSLADRFGAVGAATPISEDPDQDELLDQLAEHPDDIGLHLELVGLYYSRRDVEHFEAAAEAMHAHIADPQQDEWLDVVAMGEDLVPGHPLFADGTGHDATDDGFDEGHETAEPSHDAAGFDGFDAAAEHDHDLDTAPFGAAGFAESPAGDNAPAMPPLPVQKKVSEYHFDFNLTPPPRQDGASEPQPAEDGTEMPWAQSDADADQPQAEATTSWDFEETEAAEESSEDVGTAQTGYSGEFSDDPIDTKLDLARAYLDMGDADGARAMLEEVIAEGSQPQKDAANSLLESMH